MACIGSTGGSTPKPAPKLLPLDHAESCNSNPSPRHSLVVATSYEALASGIGSADIQGHGPITASAARRLACDYNIIPAVLGTNSEVLDLGVPNRLATPKQRFHIALCDAAACSTTSKSTKAAGRARSSTPTRSSSTHPAADPHSAANAATSSTKTLTKRLHPEPTVRFEKLRRI